MNGVFIFSASGHTAFAMRVTKIAPLTVLLHLVAFSLDCLKECFKFICAAFPSFSPDRLEDVFLYPFDLPRFVGPLRFCARIASCDLRAEFKYWPSFGEGAETYHNNFRNILCPWLQDGLVDMVKVANRRLCYAGFQY